MVLGSKISPAPVSCCTHTLLPSLPWCTCSPAPRPDTVHSARAAAGLASRLPGLLPWPQTCAEVLLALHVSQGL